MEDPRQPAGQTAGGEPNVRYCQAASKTQNSIIANPRHNSDAPATRGRLVALRILSIVCILLIVGLFAGDFISPPTPARRAAHMESLLGLGILCIAIELVRLELASLHRGGAARGSADIPAPRSWTTFQQGHQLQVRPVRKPRPLKPSKPPPVI